MPSRWTHQLPLLLTENANETGRAQRPITREASPLPLSLAAYWFFIVPLLCDILTDTTVAHPLQDCPGLLLRDRLTVITVS